jgi:hypothetical protein
LVDEVWFSRLAQPALHAWTAGEALRLGLHPSERIDPEAKALACYGLWLPARARMLLPRSRCDRASTGGRSAR